MINKIILIRHGESQWNKENRFTGWKDVDLSKMGEEEARKSGKILKNLGFYFDFSYTSVLKRAIRTLWIILEEINQIWLPVEKSWYLNERHYGALQGLNKNAVEKKYGKEQVMQWRRSLFAIPPKLSESEFLSLKNETKYMNISEQFIPKSESLDITIKRVMYYWKENIFPKVQSGKKLIIVSHGNTIRAIIKSIENLSEDEVYCLNIPTGVPIVLECDITSMKFSKHYYLNLI